MLLSAAAAEVKRVPLFIFQNRKLDIFASESAAKYTNIQILNIWEPQIEFLLIIFNFALAPYHYPCFNTNINIPSLGGFILIIFSLVIINLIDRMMTILCQWAAFGQRDLAIQFGMHFGTPRHPACFTFSLTFSLFFKIIWYLNTF